MDEGDERLIVRLAAPALVGSALLMGLVPLFAIMLRDGGGMRLDGSLGPVLWFTLKQAGLSTLLSVGPALFTAPALAVLGATSRRAALVVLALPMAVPAIVAVLGMTAIFGQSGLLPNIFSPYGLGGIVLTHVFFNLPMAARLFTQAILNTTPEALRLADSLGFNGFQRFRHIDWPAMAHALGPTAALIFLLCAASFVVVLTLGGATSTTLEVAIYQALRLDFDPGRALALSLVQLCLCSGLVVVLRGVLPDQPLFSALRAQGSAPKPAATGGQIMRALGLGAIAGLVLPPLAVIAWRGLPHLQFTAATAAALGTSLLIGLASSLAATALAWPLARARGLLQRLLSLAGLLVPPAVLATGWFLILNRLGSSTTLTAAFIIALNTLMALPFAAAALAAGFARLGPELQRLKAQLGVRGWTAWRVIDAPLMQNALAQALLMAFVLSLGDLTAITLLGNGGIITLPSLLHAQMGHYRGTEADGTAALLLALCGALTVLAQWAGERRASP